MELNKFKIELIHKLMDAKLSQVEKKELLAIAKEIVSRERDNQQKKQ